MKLFNVPSFEAKKSGVRVQSPNRSTRSSLFDVQKMMFDKMVLDPSLLPTIMCFGEFVCFENLQIIQLVFFYQKFCELATLIMKRKIELQ